MILMALAIRSSWFTRIQFKNGHLSTVVNKNHRYSIPGVKEQGDVERYHRQARINR
jgi:hypothetical protein